MYRIVKETLKDKSIRYKVETNNLLFNIFRRDKKWKTALFYDAEYDCWFDAVFDTLNEAKRYCNVETNPIIEECIIPTLIDDVAERFIKKAEYNEKHSKSIDFRKQYKNALKILTKNNNKNFVR